MNGECVAESKNEHLFELMMSGSNVSCHSMERDSSGSSNITAYLST